MNLDPRQQEVRGAASGLSIEHDGSPRTASASAESGRAALLLLLVALAGVAAWGWFATRAKTALGSGSAAQVAAPTTSILPPAGHAPSASGGAFGAQATVVFGQSAGRVSEPGRAPERPRLPDFDGTGTLRGNIRPPRGLGAPPAWTLVVEPAKTLIGGERAERRRLDFENGEDEFELADLPLGGYAVRAEAFGLQAREQLLVLSKPDQQNQLIQMQWTPNGFLEGRVLDGRDEPAANLEVHAVPRRPNADGELLPHSTLTSAGGDWLIDNLSDGDYALVLGPIAHPLDEAREIAFRSPTQRVETLRLPEIHGELQILVRDARGQPVAGASIEGYSREGGRIAGETGADGTLLARYLKAGHYTVVVRSELCGEARGREHVRMTRRATLELTCEH